VLPSASCCTHRQYRSLVPIRGCCGAGEVGSGRAGGHIGESRLEVTGKLEEPFIVRCMLGIWDGMLYVGITVHFRSRCEAMLAHNSKRKLSNTPHRGAGIIWEMILRSRRLTSNQL
jgi:hypothetical protein